MENQFGFAENENGKLEKPNSSFYNILKFKNGEFTGKSVNDKWRK